jgi:hypothetical protein
MATTPSPCTQSLEIITTLQSREAQRDNDCKWIGLTFPFLLLNKRKRLFQIAYFQIKSGAFVPRAIILTGFVTWNMLF